MNNKFAIAYEHRLFRDHFHIHEELLTFVDIYSTEKGKLSARLEWRKL